MPLIRLETNVSISDTAKLLRELSTEAGRCLGKDQQWVMASLRHEADLLYGGTADPAALVDVGSIGLTASACPEISRAICGLLERRLGIPPKRVYIRFQSWERDLTGWNGTTFGA